jgi:hypothetical protein
MSTVKSETIEVRIHQRVLWIGSEAYPVQNIARVSTAKVVYRKGAAVSRFIGYFFLWLVLGIVALVVLFASGVLETDDQTSTATVVIGSIVGILILIQFGRMVNVISGRRLWALVIETAGTSHRALVGTNKQELDRLVHEIVSAINDPSASYSMHVQNLHVGDNVAVSGSNNIGKVST